MSFGGKGVSAPAGLFCLVMAVAAMMISSSPASAKRVSFSVPISSTAMFGAVEYEAGGYTRVRVGEMGGYDGDPTFLRPRGGPFVSLAHPWVGVRKVFILGSDGILNDRKPGDMIVQEMERYNSDAADTCGNVLLSGLRLSTR